MAIAFDAAYGNQSGTGTTNTYNHTVASGNNRCLLVGAMISSTNTVNSVTFHGVNLTSLPISGGGAGGEAVQWWYLVAPDVGTFSVVITIATSQFCYANSNSYTGVDQTSPIDAKTTNTGSGGSSITTALTSIAANCWFVGICRDANNGIETASTGVTARRTTSPATGDSNASQPAGSYSMTWTTGPATGSFTVAMVSLKPAPAAPAAPSGIPQQAKIIHVL